jgi:hypothetical protein
MKKLCNKVTVTVAITFSLLGATVGAFFSKKPDTKAEAIVVVNGDTVIHKGGDSIKTGDSTWVIPQP